MTRILASGWLRRAGAKLLLVLTSLLFVLAIFAVGEIAVRIFSDINFLGNSKGLLVKNAYGPSSGNTPNVEAVSFGAQVQTDEYGFRVPAAGLPGDADKTEAILILGDSVAFASGVRDDKTTADLLRMRFPGKRVYNSSVIGYTTWDYKNVAERFVPDHQEINHVVIVYCLNDASPQSAERIKQALGKAAEPDPGGGGTVGSLKKVQLVAGINAFLRPRSKLYLLIKGLLTNPQLRYWKADLGIYTGDDARLIKSVGEIGELATFLQERGIALTVVVPPYEYQLRNPGDPATDIPPQKIGDRLSGIGVDWVDARPFFGPDRPSQDYFLAFDAMHLSPTGHRVLAEIIGRSIEAADAARFRAR